MSLNSSNINNDEETNTHTEVENSVLIDPEELIMIDDPSNWEPPKEYIIAYAKKLGFDPENDPPELLDISKKYLIKPLPENYIRAFRRDNLQILYIFSLTNEILLDMEFEQEAIEEYQLMKAKLIEEKKEEKEDKKKSEDNKEENLEKKVNNINSEINEFNQDNNNNNKDSILKNENLIDSKEKNEETINNEDSIQYIEPENIIIIDDLSSWDPPEEYINSYIKKLEFNTEDFPESYNIAKKYLLKPLPNFTRLCFIKNTYQICYLNILNNNIELIHSNEEEAKKEYEEEKKKFLEEKEKNKKDNENIESFKESEKIDDLKDNNKENKDKNDINNNLINENNNSEDNDINEIINNLISEENNKEDNGDNGNNNENVDSNNLNNDHIEDNIDNISKNDDYEIIIDRLLILEENKSNYKAFKKKLKEKFIKFKNSIDIEYKNKYNKLECLKKEKLGINLEKDRIIFLSELNKNFSMNVDIYKNDLIKNLEEKFEKDIEINQSKNKINNLNIKISELQDEINKLKNKKIQNIEEEKKRRNDIFEIKKNLIKENQKSKLLLLKQENYIKILLMQNKFEKEYEEYNYQYKNKLNNNNNIYNLRYENSQIPNNNFLLKEYGNKIKEENEFKKKEIKKEYEKSIAEKINIFKNNVVIENNNFIQESTLNKTNLEICLKNDLILFKKHINNNYQYKLEKDIFKIDNNVALIYSKEIFDKIKDEENKIFFNKDIILGMKEFFKIYNKINIEKYLDGKTVEKELKLNKIKDLCKSKENEFKQQMVKIEFYKDIILLFIKIISENNKLNNNLINTNPKNINNLNNIFLINKLIFDSQKLINNYSIKYKNICNKKLYLILEENLNIIYNQKKINKNKNILYKTPIPSKMPNILSKAHKNNFNLKNNNNISIENNNLDDITFNEELNNFSSIQSRNNIININLKSLNANKKYKDKYLFVKKIPNINNKNDNKNKSSINLLQNNCNKSTLQNRRNKSIFDSAAYSANKTKENNKKLIKNNEIFNNLSNIKSNDNKLINLPRLNENNIKNILNENIFLYKKIMNILSKKNQSLDMELNKLNSNNFINIRKEIFNKNILFKNNINNHNKKKEILECDFIKNQKNYLDKIKDECNLLIDKNLNKNSSNKKINEKLKDILQSIETNCIKSNFNSNRNSIKNLNILNKINKRAESSKKFNNFLYKKEY